MIRRDDSDIDDSDIDDPERQLGQLVQMVTGRQRHGLLSDSKSDSDSDSDND